MEINLELQMPARIISFDPLIDGNWVKENTDIDISKPLQFSEITNRIIIEDIEKSEKYSLFDLEGKLIKEGKSDNKIYVGDLSKGTYLVRCKINNKYYDKKLIVE